MVIRIAERELQRKLLRRFERDRDVRYLTFSTYKRLPLLGHAGIRDLFVEHLSRARVEHGLAVYAWVVMPEHVHMLITPTGAWEHTARSLKTQVSRAVLARWRELRAPILDSIRVGRKHRFWQHGGGFDRSVRDASEFTRDVTYIHRNPVERGLVPTPRDWKWSSVRWWMGERDGESECDPPPYTEVAWDHWRGFQ